MPPCTSAQHKRRAHTRLPRIQANPGASRSLDLPLGRRRRGGGAVASCRHRAGLGGRDPVKRVGHGFGNFANYRLRLLLHCGVTWQTHEFVGRRGRAPRLMA